MQSEISHREEDTESNTEKISLNRNHNSVIQHKTIISKLNDLKDIKNRAKSIQHPVSSAFITSLTTHLQEKKSDRNITDGKYEQGRKSQ